MKIEIEHVSKKIKDALVLDDVCMTLESGNIYGFKGVPAPRKALRRRKRLRQDNADESGKRTYVSYKRYHQYRRQGAWKKYGFSGKDRNAY